MIKNIVFDIGNVVLKFNPKEYFSNKYNDSQLGNEICDLMMQSDIWRAYDLGDYHIDVVREKFLEKLPQYHVQINQMLDEWTAILQPIEYTFKKMKQLRCKGYSLYLLSNLNEEAYEYIIKQYDLFDIVDGYVVSFKERLAKPDSRIYECLCKRYSLNKEECVFIDDLNENVEAAKMYGMKGIHFQNEEQVECEITQILEKTNA